MAEGAVLLRGFARPRRGRADRGVARDRSAGAVPPHGDAGRPPDVGGDDELRRSWLGHRSQRLSLRCRRSRIRKAVAGDAAIVSRSWPDRPRRARALPASAPDACLINRYEPGARMSLHQDRDEQDFGAPIVSVSLGLPAIFLFGGLKRSDKPRRYRLEHGDVVVWGGPARLFFHGVAPLADGEHALARPAAHQSDVPQGALRRHAFHRRRPLAMLREPRPDMRTPEQTADCRARRAPIAPASISPSCSWCSRWAGPPMSSICRNLPPRSGSRRRR